jgi:hypothetical protein
MSGERTRPPQAPKATVDEARWNEDRFAEWVGLYHGRITSVTGMAVDALNDNGCAEIMDEHHDVLFDIFLSGADPVATADEELKGWLAAQKPAEQKPADQKPAKGKQSAADSSKQWQDFQSRFDATFDGDA